MFANRLARTKDAEWGVTLATDGLLYQPILDPPVRPVNEEALMRRVALAMALAGLMAGGIAAAREGAPMNDSKNPQVRLVTSKGDIVLELDAAKAPKTVGNFLEYVRSGQFDGTIFHRVIPGFMIQGGGFTAEMQQKPTRPPIPNEAANGLHNGLGTVAMARTSDPNSASAQFFINVADNAFLDHHDNSVKGFGYCVFGKVISGMNVVKAIAKVRTIRDVPAEPVVIKSAKIVTAK